MSGGGSGEVSGESMWLSTGVFITTTSRGLDVESKLPMDRALVLLTEPAPPGNEREERNCLGIG